MNASSYSRIAADRLDRGQSMVEFVLVVPIMLVLLIAVADFARLFAVGVVVESSARDAAEIVAQRYLADPPPDGTGSPAPLSAPAPQPGDTGYYAALHDLAARTVCGEVRPAGGTDYAGGTCPTWPKVRVCVHDGADPACGGAIAGFSTSSADCPSLGAAMAPTEGPAEARRFVEVRVCHRFDLLLDLGLLPFGVFHLERTRAFTIPCYFAGPSECG